MNRKEAYASIKKFNLQDVVKSRFNRNFTQVSTDNLIEVIKQYQSNNCKKEVKEVKEVVKKEEVKNKEVKNKKVVNTEINKTKEVVNTSPFNRLVDVLYKKRILLDSEVNYILNRS